MQWFRHDSDANADAKLIKLRIKYGMEGYGLYWYCLELIASGVGANNITFELEHDAEIIAHQTGIHHERVQEMMQYMIKLNLFEQNQGVVTCFKLAKRLDERWTRSPELKQVIKGVCKLSEDKLQTVTAIREEKIIEEKIIEDKNPSCHKISFSDADMVMAVYMKEAIVGVGYDIKPNMGGWAKDVRLMRERDKISHESMKEVFDWANNDEFWSINIRSPSKFRDKYQQLKVKMGKTKRGNRDDKFDFIQD